MKKLLLLLILAQLYVIMLYYDATLDSNNGGWRSLADYDSTDVQQLRAYYARYYTGQNAVYSYKLCGIDSQGRIQPLTLETGTGTSKTVNTVAIKPDKIFYYNTPRKARLEYTPEYHILLSDFQI